MIGNFSYSNPTKLYFGEDSLNYLDQELPKYGKKILLTYGGGSIKKNGIYEAVVAALPKFARFAKNVWAISADGKSDLELAEAGLEAMKAWMQEIGVCLSLKELGVTEDMFEGIASATFILDGGYKVLTKDEVVQVLKESM